MSDSKALLNFEDVAGLSKPLTKLIEVLSIGMGKIYDPIHTVRQAKAKSKEIQIIGEALDHREISLTTYDNGIVSMDNKKGLEERAKDRSMHKEIVKQNNIESTIAYAYKELEKVDTVSLEPVDKDWIFRFMNAIEDISNEHMQFLWGKLLAGEIKQPNTFDLRTLEKLRNLTQKEAILFQKILNSTINSGDNKMLLRNDSLLNIAEIKYNELLLLEECGLLVLKNDLVYKLNINPNSHNYILNGELIAVIYNKTSIIKEYPLEVYALTTSGHQLSNMVEVKSNNDFFMASAKELKGNLKEDLEITVHKIINLDNDHINYDDVDLLNP